VPETFTRGTKAPRADSPAQSSTHVLPDRVTDPGAQARAMRTGEAFMCKGPDGVQRRYRIDETQSSPGGPVVLVAV